MLNIFKNLTTKKKLIISGVIFLLMAGVVTLYVFELINDTLFTIGLFILLMIFTTITSSIIQNRMQKRLENKKKGKPYTFSDSFKLKNITKQIKTDYGTIDLYLENRVLYSLIMINEGESFFDSQHQVKFDIDQKKYNKLIQFYVFDKKDENLFRKISIINYQAKNFYVGSFIIDNLNNTIYQTDKVIPNEEYKKVFDNFIKLLELEQ